MQIVTRVGALQTALLELQTTVDTSMGLTVFPAGMGETDVAAVRESGRICDVMVSVWGQKPSAPEEKMLKSLGVDICYVPVLDSWLCHLDCGVKEQNGTFLLHAILAVLPNIVVVSRQHFGMIRALKNIQQTFSTLFALHEVA